MNTSDIIGVVNVVAQFAVAGVAVGQCLLLLMPTKDKLKPVRSN